MARLARRPSRLEGRFFRGSAAVRRGLLTRDQLYGPAWRKVFRDVYVDSRVPDTHLLRCEAATLILPPEAVVTGRSAACLRGLAVAEPTDPVLVVVPPTRMFRAAGIRVRRVRLSESDIVPGRPPMTTPARTAWEIAGEPDLIEAVVALDILLGCNYVQPEMLRAWADLRPRSRAATAIGLTDGRAESPQETRTRLRLVLAGFPKPVPQIAVRVDGHFVARVDLAWPDAKVAVEYDGAGHGRPGQLQHDRARLNRLTDAGWKVFFLTARDLADNDHFARFTCQLAAALGRA